VVAESQRIVHALAGVKGANLVVGEESKGTTAPAKFEKSAVVSPE